VDHGREQHDIVGGRLGDPSADLGGDPCVGVDRQVERQAALCRGPSPLLRSDREGGRADEGDGLENGLRVAFSAAMRRPRRCAVCAESAGFLETAHQGASRVNQVWGADTRLRAVTRHFPAFSIMAAKVLGG
jgi:hypothetical protein